MFFERKGRFFSFIIQGLKYNPLSSFTYALTIVTMIQSGVIIRVAYRNGYARPNHLNFSKGVSSEWSIKMDTPDQIHQFIIIQWNIDDCSYRIFRWIIDGAVDTRRTGIMTPLHHHLLFFSVVRGYVRRSFFSCSPLLFLSLFSHVFSCRLDIHYLLTTLLLHFLSFSIDKSSLS